MTQLEQTSERLRLVLCADRKLLVMTCSHGDVCREGLYDLDKCQIVAMLPDGEYRAFNRDSLRGRDTLMAILRPNTIRRIMTPQYSKPNLSVLRRKSKTERQEQSVEHTGYEIVFIDYVHVRPKRNGRMCAYCEGR